MNFGHDVGDISMELEQALTELREEKERKFKQSVDLIVNLKGVDLRKTNVNAVITIPHKIKEKKVCGFLTEKNELVQTITKLDFKKCISRKNFSIHFFHDLDNLHCWENTTL